MKIYITTRYPIKDKQRFCQEYCIPPQDVVALNTIEKTKGCPRGVKVIHYMTPEDPKDFFEYLVTRSPTQYTIGEALRDYWTYRTELE